MEFSGSIRIFVTIIVFFFFHQEVMAEAYKKLWGKEVMGKLSTPQFCPGLNVSTCEVSEESDDVRILCFLHVKLNCLFLIKRDNVTFVTSSSSSSSSSSLSLSS